jgi:hypothetical protein
MGTAGQFTPEKLVMGILCSRPAREKELLDGLVERWGRIDYRSETFPFTFTHYYDEEMDGPIGRLFVSFERLVDPSTLAAIKRETNAIEHTFREDGGRRVNIDPGLMALSRFTLATTKENAHRIPLSDGIYAEITLLYARGGFQPLEWTYPDFRSERYRALLSDIRALYKAQLPALRS